MSKKHRAHRSFAPKCRLVSRKVKFEAGSSISRGCSCCSGNVITVPLAACLVLAEVSSIKVETNGCQVRKGDAGVPSLLGTSGLSSFLLTLMLAEIGFKWFPSCLHGDRAVNCGRKEFGRVQQQHGCCLELSQVLFVHNFLAGPSCMAQPNGRLLPFLLTWLF